MGTTCFVNSDARLPLRSPAVESSLECSKEGAIADVRGERVRVYSDPVLRAKIKNEIQTALNDLLQTSFQSGAIVSDHYSISIDLIF